ncbi:ferritin-like domain-containing protein, partial [Bacteroides xylanisolvens]|uniref:ferritin-like domain-containing protein n=1 Tax=Bacteroides xylanisolvens TaxID=371601 RepID=UPI0021D484D9
MSEKLQNALNEQITAELWSANLYLSMSFYLKKEGFSAQLQISVAYFCSIGLYFL